MLANCMDKSIHSSHPVSAIEGAKWRRVPAHWQGCQSFVGLKTPRNEKECKVEPPETRMAHRQPNGVLHVRAIVRMIVVVVVDG